jgi:signal transduction histidine kinase
MGLKILDLAMIHRRALTTLVTPAGDSGSSDGILKRAEVFHRAETFFVEAIKPIEQNNRAALETNVQLTQLNQTLRQRTVELAAANRRLKHEIVRRQAGVEALRKSRRHYRQLVGQSHLQPEQLRHPARQMLSALEEERKKFSRELHDDVAQTLTGINAHLATLIQAAVASHKGLKQTVSRPQRLVE